MSEALLNIGAAAAASGLSAKMIRHYENLGLFPDPPRTEAGYRLYGPNELATLRFIRRSRELGFSVAQIGDLLALWQDRHRPSAEVKALAQAHIAELDAKLHELQQMKASLLHLVKACRGDGRPDCPILDGLAAPKKS